VDLKSCAIFPDNLAPFPREGVDLFTVRVKNGHRHAAAWSIYIGEEVLSAKPQQSCRQLTSRLVRIHRNKAIAAHPRKARRPIDFAVVTADRMRSVSTCQVEPQFVADNQKTTTRRLRIETVPTAELP
jgi:hypothetical protein